MTLALAMDELLETAPCSFLAFDDDGTIALANATLAELLGYGREDLLGLPIDRLLTTGNRIFYHTHLFPLLKLKGRADEIHVALRARSGDEVPVLMNALRKEHDGGWLNHCAMIQAQRRISFEEEIVRARRAAEEALESNEELVRAKEELERYARELDRKLASLEQKNQELAHVSQVLSHGLREPIRKIAWFAQQLDVEDQAVPAAASQAWVDKITEACRQADGLLHTLREFVSLDAGGEDAEEVSLGQVFAAAITELQEQGAAPAVHLEGEELPTVRGVRRQLVFLFRSLLRNALERAAQASAAHVDVRWSLVHHNSYRVIAGKYRYEQYARIVLRDHGEQWPVELRQRAFEPATHGRDGAVENGFALAGCRKVVENHGGEIAVATGVEQGVAFVVLLPLGS